MDVVPVRPQGLKRSLSPEREEKFLAALRTTKMNVTAACRVAGMKGTGAVYTHRRQDPEFAEKWLAVEEEILDTLEEAQYRAAEEKAEDRRFVLARRRAKRWSEKAALAVAVQSDQATPSQPASEMSDDQLLQIANTGAKAIEGEFSVAEADD